MFAVSTSSWKSTSRIPACATSSGVPSRVIPMKPTLMPFTVLIVVGGSTVRPVGAVNQLP